MRQLEQLKTRESDDARSGCRDGGDDPAGNQLRAVQISRRDAVIRSSKVRGSRDESDVAVLIVDEATILR